MITDNKGLFRAYAALKQQEKDIENQIKEIAPKILKMMIEETADKINSLYGTFSIEKRKTWKYTQAVKLAEEHLIGLQEKEKATGKATFEERPILKYFSPKIQNEE